MNCFDVCRVLVAGFGVAGLLATGCSGPVAAPTSFTTYAAKDQSFAIDYPDSWEAVGGGQSGFYSARFTSGSASIKVTADMVGSVIGNIVDPNSTSSTEEVPEELKAIYQVHEMGKEKMAEEFANFQESPATPVQTAFGDSRLAEFIGGGSFGGKMHGYRLTALGVDRRITVVCCCRENDWKTLEPAFRKAIATLKHGR
ncbi:MAG: hypothetical protein HUU20_07005 [Pirellulales bacterium]|nr:hypothetical protein [Pirellulales bacterium]